MKEELKKEIQDLIFELDLTGGNPKLSIRSSKSLFNVNFKFKPEEIEECWQPVQLTEGKVTIHLFHTGTSAEDLDYQINVHEIANNAIDFKTEIFKFPCLIEKESEFPKYRVLELEYDNRFCSISVNHNFKGVELGPIGLSNLNGWSFNNRTEKVNSLLRSVNQFNSRYIKCDLIGVSASSETSREYHFIINKK